MIQSPDDNHFCWNFLAWSRLKTIEVRKHPISKSLDGGQCFELGRTYNDIHSSISTTGIPPSKLAEIRSQTERSLPVLGASQHTGRERTFSVAGLMDRPGFKRSIEAQGLNISVMVPKEVQPHAKT